MPASELFQALSGTLYLITITVVGARLLFLAARNRSLPELMLGIALVAGGTLGATCEVVAAQAAEPLGPARAGALLGFGKLCGFVGLNAYGLFIWRVFRAGEAWAAVLFFALVAISAAALVGFASRGAFATGAVPSDWFWIEFAGRIAGPIWLTFESARYYGQMRRRQQLGLADPLVTNRFLLWAIAAGCGVVMLLTSVPPLFIASDDPRMAVNIVVLGLSGVFASAPYWLAFFPPAAYVRRVRAAAA